MTPPTSFRRLVLEVGQGASGPSTLRGAAELARFLGLALHCVLVQDEALFNLPSARELRLPTREWRKLDPGQLAAEFAAMETALRRNLEALGVSLGIAQTLEVQRGDPEACLVGLCVAGDIVVLAEGAPGQPRPHLTARLHALALRSAASVLLLPAAPPPAATPVAAVLANPDDPALAVAATIAAASGAALLVVLAEGDAAQVAAHAARMGIPPARLALRPAGGHDAAALDAALGVTRTRLLVMDAASWDNGDLASVLARRHATPVLLVETRAPADQTPLNSASR